LLNRYIGWSRAQPVRDWFRPDVDSDALAVQIIATVDGRHVPWALNPDNVDMGRCSPATSPVCGRR
jgi:hypothetical protein